MSGGAGFCHEKREARDSNALVITVLSETEYKMANAADKTKKETTSVAEKRKAAQKSTAKKVASKANDGRKNAPVGFFGRTKAYFKGVRAELHRVTWPTKSDVLNYTLIVLGTLVFFGVLIWVLDSLILPAFVGFSGLRG